MAETIQSPLRLLSKRIPQTLEVWNAVCEAFQIIPAEEPSKDFLWIHLGKSDGIKCALCG